MLLNALNPQDTPPLVSESDLLDLSPYKEDVLDKWDQKLAGIYAEYQTHPQCLRPLRLAMEERLTRAFSGAINKLRQIDLGIEEYIWETVGDEKVRDAHAGKNG